MIITDLNVQRVCMCTVCRLSQQNPVFTHSPLTPKDKEVGLRIPRIQMAEYMDQITLECTLVRSRGGGRKAKSVGQLRGHGFDSVP